jgi:Leucine-rich repeat (LRR) protein
MTQTRQPQRIQNPERIDAAAIRAAIASGQQVLVQFDTLAEPGPLLADLDALAATCGTALTIRIYGYDPRVFDARILRALPHVASLSIDCHWQAIHLEVLGELRHLKRLSLGVYQLAEADILQLDNLRGLEYLNLGESAKNNIDLAPLRHYAQLASLVLEGHSKHIDTLAGLPALHELSLYRIKNKVPLDFISAMDRLDRLLLQLGGRESLAHIEAPLLKKLEVIRVRGLETLGDIGRFPLLQALWVEDQIKLRQIALGANPVLERLSLHTCKTLDSLPGLAALPALRQLSASETMLDVDALLAHGLPASLTHVRLRTGKKTRDDAIAAQLAQLGYDSARAVLT